ncbi:HD domain-containing protein [Candidatus Woesearchaeota archaeon]|nr:MAG: HD domain-containing protein [Candidatus Woesearchaeota archaeon]
MFDGSYLTPKKRIIIPVYGSVDVTQVRDIINLPEFQRTGHIYQLGLNHLIFRGATHTRFVHMVGTLKQCREYTRPLVMKGMISKDDARHIEAAGLLHDVGHGPFSHAVEKVLEAYGSKYKDHKEHTLALLKERFSHTLSRLGFDPSRVVQIVAKKEPLSALISHKTLGADKVSYVRLDQHYVGYPSSALAIGDIPENLLFVEGTIGVDERMHHNVQLIQRAYFDMYTQVYLRKQDCAAVRVLERAVQQSIEDGLSNADDVWKMTDSELLVSLKSNKGRWNRAVDNLFFNRGMHCVAVSLRVRGHESKELKRGKSISILPMKSPSEFFDWYSDPKRVIKAESAVSQMIGASLDDVIITCTGNPYSLALEDVQLFDPYANKLSTLFERYPDHARSLKEQSQFATACRVMVRPEFREKAYDCAQEISDLLHEVVGEYSKNKEE